MMSASRTRMLVLCWRDIHTVALSVLTSYIVCPLPFFFHMPELDILHGVEFQINRATKQWESKYRVPFHGVLFGSLARV